MKKIAIFVAVIFFLNCTVTQTVFSATNTITVTTVEEFEKAVEQGFQYIIVKGDVVLAEKLHNAWVMKKIGLWTLIGIATVAGAFLIVTTVASGGSATVVTASGMTAAGATAGGSAAGAAAGGIAGISAPSIVAFASLALPIGVVTLHSILKKCDPEEYQAQYGILRIKCK